MLLVPQVQARALFSSEPTPRAITGEPAAGLLTPLVTVSPPEVPAGRGGGGGWAGGRVVTEPDSQGAVGGTQQ